MPIITGTTPEPFADVTGFMLAGRSTKPDTALLFLNDYLITPSTMEDLFTSSSGLPAYEATAELIATDPVLAGLLEAARNGVPTPTVNGIDEVVAALGPILADIVGVGGEEISVLLDTAAAMALELAV